jgi:hypothetical protein
MFHSLSFGETMELPKKLPLFLAMTRIHKQWLSVSFSHCGSLYYAKDMQPLEDNHYVQDGKVVKYLEFATGP